MCLESRTYMRITQIIKAFGRNLHKFALVCVDNVHGFA